MKQPGVQPISTLDPTRRNSGGRSMGGVFVPLGMAIVLLLITTTLANSDPGSKYLIPLALFSGLVVLQVVALDLRCGLALFIVSVGLSPKLPGLGYNSLRVEDGVFALVFIVWLVRCLRTGRIPRLRSPVTMPFLAITLLGIISTLWGLSHGTVHDTAYSLLVQVKRVQYFLIFWVVATSVTSNRWLRTLILLSVVSGAVASLYGFSHPEQTGYLTYAQTRIGGPAGEDYNMLSGYFVVCLGVGIAALAEFKQRLTRPIVLASVALLAAGILLAFSREGLLMLLGSLTVLLKTRHRAVAVAAFFLLVPFLLTGPVRSHLEATITKIEESRSGELGTNSLSARFAAWRYNWDRYIAPQPLIGSGIGSARLSVDNEFVLRACEGGVIGLGLFIYLLVAISRQVNRIERRTGDVYCRLMGTGLFMALTGLLIQSLAAVSFTAIRPMEAFWFLLGLGGAALTHGQKQERMEPRWQRNC